MFITRFILPPPFYVSPYTMTPRGTAFTLGWPRQSTSHSIGIGMVALEKTNNSISSAHYCWLWILNPLLYSFLIFPKRLRVGLIDHLYSWCETSKYTKLSTFFIESFDWNWRRCFAEKHVFSISAKSRKWKKIISLLVTTHQNINYIKLLMPQEYQPIRWISRADFALAAYTACV